MIVKINSAEILKLEKDGENIIFNPKAEEALVKLLEMQRELDGAVEYLKGEIERQALEFNPNFTGLKGEKIKINYSASGAKFRDTGEITYHRNKFWSKKTVWSLDSKAIEEYKAKNRKLPKGIAEIHRRKTIRISEVQNG
jgi:hypothetical protein